MIETKVVVSLFRMLSNLIENLGYCVNTAATANNRQSLELSET